MKKLLIFALLAACPWPLATAQQTPPPNFVYQAFTTNASGLTVPCAGCSLYTYVAGGTTGQTTYTTANGSTPNSNPIVLDSKGSAQMWTVPGLSYRFDLYDASLTLIRSVDNVPGGTLAGQSTVTANYIYAGPASGAAAAPAFRAPVVADLPASIPLTSSNFGSEGTTTTLLHGNAGGVLAFSNVVPADFGTAIAARTALGNPTASAAAPSMSTTVDALAYQVAEIPAFSRVTTDFTTSGVGTALEPITGLSFTIPASTALNVPFSCHLIYHQNTANVAVAFGIQDVTVSPTNITAAGTLYTSATVLAAGNVAALATTTATAVVSGTPSAITTNWNAEVSGMVEAPSNASSSAVNFMVSTATAADTVTVLRGSYCRLN
jgi:hypothetical protein